MTFAAVGSIINATASTFSLTPGGVGDLILIEVQNTVNATVQATALASSNVTWTQMGTAYAGVNVNATAVVFGGKVTSTSTATVTVTWSGTTPSGIGIDGQEFSSTAGAWTLDVQGHIDGVGTTTWASLTPAAAGELYFGYCLDSGTATAGSTSGYTYDVDAQTNGMAYNPACTSAAQAPVWGDPGMIFGVMVLVKETGGGGAPSGKVQPRATVPVPRRRRARAVVQSVLGLLNAHGPSGTVQPRATVPVPRRKPARAQWQHVTGPANAHGPSGQVQPTAAVPVPRRRKLTRAYIQFMPVRTVNATPATPVNGTVQPRATVTARSRRPARAVIRFIPPAPPLVPSGTVQSRATLVTTRRKPSRALIPVPLIPLVPVVPPGTEGGAVYYPYHHRGRGRTR